MKGTKARAPLTPIQKGKVSSENEMVGRKKVQTLSLSKDKDAEEPPRAGTAIISTSATVTTSTEKVTIATSPTKASSSIAKVKSGGVSKRTKEKTEKIEKVEKSDKSIQTDNPYIDLITGDEAPLEYWKRIAEERREALEETLIENQDLHERIESLEQEKEALEEMVQDAKRLATLVNDFAEDMSAADESGISLN